MEDVGGTGTCRVDRMGGEVHRVYTYLLLGAKETHTSSDGGVGEDSQ